MAVSPSGNTATRVAAVEAYLSAGEVPKRYYGWVHVVTGDWYTVIEIPMPPDTRARITMQALAHASDGDRSTLYQIGNYRRNGVAAPAGGNTDVIPSEIAAGTWTFAGNGNNVILQFLPDAVKYPAGKRMYVSAFADVLILDTPPTVP